MFKNYFTTAINNLIKYKLYSAINIMGLATGLAACIVIALYVQDESSYDKQWKNADSIYRMHYTFAIPGGEALKFPFAPVPAKAALELSFPEEIEYATRASRVDMVVNIGDAKFEEALVIVDSIFNEMFEFEVLSGSIESTLTDPSNIALSEEVAIRFFGAQEAVGQVLTATTEEVSRDYQVTAVYSVSGNTILDVPMLSLFDETGLPDYMFTWVNVWPAIYIQLKPGADIKTVEVGMLALIEKNVDPSDLFADSSATANEVVETGFENIKTIHLGSPWDRFRVGGDKAVVLAFSIISVLILIIGVINFTILTTAKATQRAREVAMRKILGARRNQLIVHFLGESFLIVMLAMVLSLAMVELMLPTFEAMVGKDLAVNYTTLSTFLYLLALLLLVGTSGGLYPAFILSNFRPSSTLKSIRYSETKGSRSLRSVLIVFQFSVSIALMIATSVIYAQLQYANNRDPGFNKENLIVINTLRGRPALQEMAVPFKQELLNLASVSDVGFSSMQPSEDTLGVNIYTRQGQSNSHTINGLGTGFDYFQTYQIPLVAGRYYDRERDSNDFQNDSDQELIENSIIANVSAVRELGFSSLEEAVGKALNSSVSNINYKIIGVVADNHISSINALPRAEMYFLNAATQLGIVTIRFHNSPQEIVDQINTIWRDVMGDASLTTVFVVQLLAEEFEQEQTEARMLVSFSLLAILISCLGLFGSASFTVDRRTKEIGLRKVMGAKVNNIVSLLIWRFTKTVLIANLIAWPLAIWAMINWLERFSYQINAWLLLPICIVAGLIALLIATLTVTSNTVRVARRNPIHALRYE